MRKYRQTTTNPSCENELCSRPSSNADVRHVDCSTFTTVTDAGFRLKRGVMVLCSSCRHKVRQAQQKLDSIPPPAQPLAAPGRRANATSVSTPKTAETATIVRQSSLESPELVNAARLLSPFEPSVLTPKTAGHRAPPATPQTSRLTPNEPKGTTRGSKRCPPPLPDVTGMALVSLARLVAHTSNVPCPNCRVGDVHVYDVDRSRGGCAILFRSCTMCDFLEGWNTGHRIKTIRGLSVGLHTLEGLRLCMSLVLSGDYGYAEYRSILCGASLEPVSADCFRSLQGAMRPHVALTISASLKLSRELVARRDPSLVGSFTQQVVVADGFWSQRSKKNRAGSSPHGAVAAVDFFQHVVLAYHLVSNHKLRGDKPTQRHAIDGSPASKSVSRALTNEFANVSLNKAVTTATTSAALGGAARPSNTASSAEASESDTGASSSEAEASPSQPSSAAAASSGSDDGGSQSTNTSSDELSVADQNETALALIQLGSNTVSTLSDDKSQQLMEAKQIEAFHKRRESERGLASQSFEAFAYRKVLHQLVNLKVRIGIAEVQAGY